MTGMALSESQKEYQRSYQLARYRSLMQEARERLGSRCVICGTTENLEIDHIDPSTKLFTFGGKRPSREVWEAELTKCQLLCHDHHLEKTSLEQRIETHGTWGPYKRGCRCEECIALVRKYYREYKRRNKAR